MKVIEKIKVLLIIALLALAFQCSHRAAPEEYYSGDDSILFYTPSLEALYNVLSMRMEGFGIVLDRSKISDICVKSIDDMPSPMNAGVYNTITGEIYIVDDIMDEPMLAYWVLAHEVGHSQGIYEHIEDDLLMSPYINFYKMVIVAQKPVNEVIAESYLRNLKDKFPNK